MRFRGGGVGHSFVPITNHDHDPTGPDTTPPIEDEPPPQPVSDPSVADEEEPESDSSEEDDEDERHDDMSLIPDDVVDDFDAEDGEGNLLDVVNEEGFGDL